MEVYYLTDPLFYEHDPGVGHPENSQRLSAIERGIDQRGLRSRLLNSPFSPADLHHLTRVHFEDYVRFVLSTKGRSYVFDPDTHTSPLSVEAALLAAGACIKGVDLVLSQGRRATVFCALRPPGHHALRGRAMGFCLFNNVAIAAAYAMDRYGVSRIAILDPDLHHGNGTQEIFYDSPHVLYISTHRYPYYPGTGSLDEIGTGEGTGYTLNFPLPGGAGEETFIPILDQAILPALERYRPELIIVSAGFDAHKDDPLGDLALTTLGFCTFYSHLVAFCLANAIPFFFALEGGYNLKALEETVPLLLSVLLDETFDLKASSYSLPPWLKQMIEVQKRRINEYLHPPPTS